MVFSSLLFLFYFLPAVLLVYFLTPHKYRNSVLLVFSLFFYAWGEPLYILLMLFAIGADFAFGRCIHANLSRGSRIGAKKVLILSVILNLSLLGFFKYADFLIEALNLLPGISLPLPGLPLPIGISFYTFQALSYLIDLYRGEVEVQDSIVDFAAYVSLFPQLIAGPIVRMSDVSAELKQRRESAALFASGVRRFVIGLGKKVLLANNIGAVWELISGQNPRELSVLSAWIGLLAFTFQIYFDFSGYSDMAIGLGRMFGFHFMENFNYPYTALSVTDFWRRWHISLSTWFREYVYIPLGGNRCGRIKQLRNLMTVWLLTGIWHGASWNFVVWGLYFGILLTVEKLFLLRLLDKAPKIIRRAYTMLTVMAGWAVFAFDSLGSGLSYLRALTGGFGQAFTDSSGIYLLYTNAILILLLTAASSTLPMRLYRSVKQRLSSAPTLLGAAETIPLLLIFICSVAYLVDASYNPFLYFRF